MKVNKVAGEDLDWCFDYESKVETLRVLNLLDGSLTGKGLEAKNDLEKFISDNADRYFQLTNR